MGNDTLRRLQLVQLDMLDVFVALCEKHNLRYFLDGGTMLGAARHKGFIPWDDDIDVGMPREDYEKFVQICKKEQPEGYFFQEARTYPKYFLVFGKLKKDNTKKIEDDPPPFYPDEHRGINIDIFPYDLSTAKDTMTKKIQSAVLKKLRYLLWEKRGYTADCSHIKNLAKKFFAALMPNSFLHALAHFIMTLKTGNCDALTCWDGVYPYQRETFPLAVLFPLGKLEFEGKQYCVPGNWDAYLKNLYGDYMQLPPENEREAHGSKIIFDVEKDEGGSY